ncbi:MAG: PD-(D/E)XK nuclease family protein [Anaerolineales bacterium]|nr:PD-(D/E)XK nuclease family protein [Anaerolineales bacterium]
MTAKIMIGPARSGKTEMCFRQIRAQDCFREKWVIVPDRIQSRLTVAQLAAAGGALGVGVGTFSDFYRYLLEMTAEDSVELNELDVRRMLRALVEEAAADGMLPHTAAIAEKPGFVEVLRDQVRELLQADIPPQLFKETAVSAGSELMQELSFLYSRYQEAKREHHRHDADDAGRIVLARLCGQDETKSRIACVVVDGFDSFSGLQLAILRELAHCVESLWITLPGDVDMQRPVFRRFLRARTRVRECIPDAEIQVLPSGTGTTLADALGTRLFEEQPESLAADPAVVMQEARSPAQEAREALRWLKSLILREQISVERCALVVPALSRYRPALDSAAAEFGIPIAYHSEQTLGEAPLAAALLGLCSLTLKDWPRHDLLTILASPYFDFSICGIKAADASAYEAVSRYVQIVEGLPEWMAGLEHLMRLRQTEDPLTSVWAAFPRGDEARRLRDGLSSLAQLLQVPAGKQSYSFWSEWLTALIIELKLETRLCAEGEEEALGGVEDLLRDLAQPMPGTATGCSYARFMEEFRRALDTTRWVVEPARNAVSVLESAQARKGMYSVLAVLGLSEGLLPEIEREDPFLPDAIRKQLGMEPHLGSEQRGLFYQVLTRADRYLLLSRPYLSDVGAPWEASPYWRACAQLFPGTEVRMRADAPRPLADAASREELLQWSARRGSLEEEGRSALGESWQSYQHASRIFGERARGEQSAYNGWIKEFQAELEEWFPLDYIWSASALESYGTCPHQFFVTRVLELEALVPPEPGYDALQLGNMLHELLEGSYRVAAQPEEAESVIAALHEIAVGVFERAPEKYGFKPNALWPVQQTQWIALLENTILELQKRQRGWKPLAMERSFGMRGEPPLALRLEGRQVLLRGIVDRIDQDADGNLCVIDYKTGSASQDARALDEGTRLQLPIYAMAVAGMGFGGEAREGFYWRIPQARRGSLMLSTYRPDIPELAGIESADAFDAARVHIAHILSGIQQGRFPPKPPQRGCPSYCPAAVWCWRYSPGRGG